VPAAEMVKIGFSFNSHHMIQIVNQNPDRVIAISIPASIELRVKRSAVSV
jgi:hypothetical protein